MIGLLIFAIVCGVLWMQGLWPLAILLAIVAVVWFIRQYNATHFVPFGIGLFR